MTVKYQAEIETPTEYTGYLVDEVMNVPMADGNRQYQEVQVWIAEGNTPEDAFTQEELDDYAHSQEVNIQDSMIIEGQKLGVEDVDRITVGSEPIIEDKSEHDTWMKNLYDNRDDEPNIPTLFKPPAVERQLLTIRDEDRDTYTFTRYQDQWGYRWNMELYKEDITNLAIAIYDQDGNYLYTTGALISTGDGKWYTQCPPGQADETVENVYFKWLLGSADISGLEVYRKEDDTKKGFVSSDERYD